MHYRRSFKKFYPIKFRLNFHYIFVKFKVTHGFINFTMFILDIVLMNQLDELLLLFDDSNKSSTLFSLIGTSFLTIKRKNSH